MPLPLKDYVQQVLLENDRAAAIYRVVQRAWSTVDEKYVERGRWRRKSTLRGLFWEEAVRELSALSLNDVHFKIIEHCDTVSFILEDAVLIRFKHADVSLSTANYPTSEASMFDEHDADLYGFKGLQRVELCYVLDEFETKIIWLGVAARSHGTHLWKIELNDTGIVAPPAELPSELESDPAKIASLKKVTDKAVEKRKRDSDLQ